MCSLALPETLFGSDATTALRSAVADVVERSFFSMADECDAESFERVSAEIPAWVSASVQFDEGSSPGAVVCWIAAPLAERLFDAFSGRDPDEPPPSETDLYDLVGEFANMVCGAWLTRAVNQQTFSLTKPVVDACDSATAIAAVGDRGLTFFIDDMPIAIDVQVGRAETRPAGVLA
mgnify:CR=1 FL=1